MTHRRDDGARRKPTRRAHEKESPRTAQVLAGRADRGLWWALSAPGGIVFHRRAVLPDPLQHCSHG